MLSAFFSALGFKASAQDENETTPKAPSWVCEDGYWVVESNISNKLQHTIYFYNGQKQLIGRKELSGVKLNLRKPKTKKMLKESLEASLQAWAKR